MLDISERSGSTKQDKERGKQNKKAPRAVISWKDKEESLDNQISSSESSSEGYNRGNLGLEGHMTPESAYEWLGLRTVEPTTRPPILELTKRNDARVAWASKDCMLSGSMLRRARPARMLEGSFFDRLELIRRVAVSEVAKAGNAMEAISVLGIVFDREALILAAEEVYGITRGRALVLDTSPGNYDELAMRIASERRTRRYGKRREFTTKVDGKNTRPLSKGSTPYVSRKPFRRWGVEVLHLPRRPRTASIVTPTRGAWGSRHWIHESAMGSMEGAGGTQADIPMVAKRSSHSLERPSTKEANERRYEEARQGNKEGNEEVDKGWSIQLYTRRGGKSRPSIFNPQEIRGEEVNTRSKSGEFMYTGTTLYSAWGSRRGNSCQRQQLALLSRPNERVSTSIHGEGGTQLSWGTNGREDSDIERASIWAIHKPVHIHETNKLGCRNCKKEDRAKSSCLYRRLSSRVRNEGATRSRTRDYSRVIWKVGNNAFEQEAHNYCEAGGASGIYVVSGAQDYWNYEGAVQGIQAKHPEPPEDTTASSKMAKDHREIDISTRSGWTNPQTCEESVEDITRQEEGDKDCGIRRSQRGFTMVAQGIEREEGAESDGERGVGISDDRCIGYSSELRLRDREEQNREEFRSEEQRLKYKRKRARRIIKMFRRTGGSIRGQKTYLVYGQYHSSSGSYKTRNAELKFRHMEHNEDNTGHNGEETHKDISKTCSWNIKQARGCTLSTWATGGQVGRSTERSGKKMGANGVGSMWLHKTSHRTFRRPLLGNKEGIGKTAHTKDRGNIGPPEAEGGYSGEKRPSIILEKLRHPHNTNMETVDVVEPVGGHETRMDRPGADSGRGLQGMGVEEFTSALMDSISAGNEGSLWAPNTRKKYKRVLTKFATWCRTQGKKEEKGTKEELSLLSYPANIPFVKWILPYLEYLACYTSGENVSTIGSILLRAAANHISEIELKYMKTSLKTLRQRANQSNPPSQQAADAVTLEDLHKLLKKVEGVRMNSVEAQSLEIFIIAFATTSRVAEICALTVRDTNTEGSAISIRTKTFASTCQRHIKKVGDGCGLFPKEILGRRRRQALLEGRKLLFSESRTEDKQLTSAAVTTALKRICKKAKVEARITSHSARKGSAVSALISGIPVVVIQSFGMWACLDSLQAYLGRAVRERFNILELIKRYRSAE